MITYLFACIARSVIAPLLRFVVLTAAIVLRVLFIVASRPLGVVALSVLALLILAR